MCTPALFKWVATNVPSGSVCYWDFGTNVELGQDTFYAFIKDPGKVSVQLTVKSPGSTCKITKNDFVEVYSKPVPQYYASRKILCDGADSVTYFDVTPISAKRSWVIDGTNYFNGEKKQKHVYSSTGLKKVSLIVEDSNGCRTIREFDTAAIIHKDVILDFKANYTSGCIRKKVAFTPTINSNGLKIMSYKWTFPGAHIGNQFKEKPDTVDYNVAGSFSPSFEVKAENGCIHALTKQNFIAFGYIDSITLKVSDTAICQGKMVVIENSDKTLPGKFIWTLNGTTKVDTPDKYTCKAIYDTLGKYNIGVTYDYNGCTVSKQLQKILRVKGVKAEFTSIDYFHCKFPHIVHFKNESESYEKGTMQYSWMIFSKSGLLRTSTNLNDSFEVQKTGQYDVRLIVRHSNGCVDTSFKQNYVYNKVIAPNFNTLFRVGCINQPIEFLQRTPRSSYKAPDQFKWTFFDKDSVTILGYSNEINPKFPYKDTGFYSVKMVADNGIGCKDSITKHHYIEIVDPKIKYELLVPIMCKDELLISKGISTPERANFRYFWYLKNRNDGTEIYQESDSFRRAMKNLGPYDFKFVHQIHTGCRDSIVNNDLIKVNGVSSLLTLDTLNGCSPLEVNPTIKVFKNYYFGNKDSSINFSWGASPPTNTVITNPQTTSPQFVFNLTGKYSSYVQMVNSVGCISYLHSQEILVGVRADFFASDYIVCAGQEISLLDQSSLNPTTTRWLLKPEAFTTDALDGNAIKVRFDNEGVHKVGLLATKLDYCYDTLYKYIKSIIVKAAMTGVDRTLKCAPVYAQFNSTSRNADSLIWNFGDSTTVTTTDLSVANIYWKNSGSTKGFDITLIAKSNEGCSDTLFEPDYQKVIGPVPSFKLLNNVGCDPLQVTFVNTSQDVIKQYINHGDGSPLDSAYGKHVYTRLNKDSLFQEYLPKIYTIDSLGCKAEFESPVKVIVKENSIANFTLSDTAICENETITYSDNSSKKISSSLYLNSEGSSRSPVTSNTITLPRKGCYDFTQIVKNTNDCFDSLKRKVIVHPNPKANFDSYDTLCLFKQVNFTNTSTFENPLVDYRWEIINQNIPVSYLSKHIKHSFDKYGLASVSLGVTDIYNCKSTYLKILSIPNPADIPPGDLSYVSVSNDSMLVIVSKPPTYSRFLLGNLYLNTKDWIHSTNSKNQETFNFSKQKGIDTSMCFDFKTLDVCGYESGVGNKHCTIFLDVKSNKPFTNQLNWTPYVGWPVIDHYTIYRKKNGESYFSLLEVVNCNTTTYLDSGLCSLPYSYYITASYSNLISKSNVRSNTPLFIFPPPYKDVINVSVKGENSIEIKWQATNNPNFKDYKLYRTCIQTNKNEISFHKSASYIDNDVNTDLYNYIYFVSETDNCDNASASQYEGKNILLNAISKDYKTNINWNTYKSWKKGVKEYRVQLEKEGNFKTIYSTTNADSSFVHDQTLENIHGPYCYRIMALSNLGYDTSFSNISCIISPSTLFFPNAFTPNGDEINEKIKAKSLFMENKTEFSGRNFSLEIFDRWGEKVFSSHDLDGEWDGIYNGKMVQTGVYLYYIKGMGIDNRSYSITGNLSIIR